jgi:hypothetical protein
MALKNAEKFDNEEIINSIKASLKRLDDEMKGTK